MYCQTFDMQSPQLKFEEFSWKIPELWPTNQRISSFEFPGNPLNLKSHTENLQNLISQSENPHTSDRLSPKGGDKTINLTYSILMIHDTTMYFFSPQYFDIMGTTPKCQKTFQGQMLTPKFKILGQNSDIFPSL